MTRCFIFRINYDDNDAHQWLMDEIFFRGNLRQGWGKRNLQLIEANGIQVQPNEWRIRYAKHWQDSEEEILRRYNTLSRMLEIDVGDLIVVPKTGSNNVLTICKASGTYSFDHDTDTVWDDFRHVIGIESPTKYGYSSYAEAISLSSKFKAYQSAVNNVLQSSTIDAIQGLYGREPSSEAKNIHQIASQLAESALEPLAEKLLDIDPNRFEDIIAACLESRGYEIVGMRKYDGRGADVDIVASYPLPFFSEVTDQAPILLFQIKKKKGMDWNDVEGVNQLIQSGREYENPIKVLVNTADEISEEAAESAASHGIKIVSGFKIIEFILKSELGKGSIQQIAAADA